MNKDINEWMHEAQFWKEQKDVFNIKEGSFFKAQKDFYIKLFLAFSNMLKEYEDKEVITGEKEKLLIAKTLLMFGDEDTSYYFYGIDYNECILYSACIYYLLGYNFNSYLLASIVDLNEVSSKTLVTLTNILKNKYTEDDELIWLLKRSNDELDCSILKPIIEKFNKQKEMCENVDEYIFVKILLAIAKRNYDDNNRIYINEFSKVDINLWKEFIKKQTGVENIQYKFSLFQKKVIKQKLFEQKTFYLNFVSRKEKNDTFKLILFEKIYGYKEENILYIQKNIIDEDKILSNLSVGNFDIKNIIKFIEIKEIIKDPKILNKYSTIIFDDISVISDLNLGVKYEYLISKMKNLDKKSILVDNSMYYFDLDKFIGINNQEQINENLNNVIIYYYSEKTQNYVIRVQNEFKEIEDKVLLENKFENKFKFKKLSKTNNIHKSLLTALKLIDIGNRVFIFIPQANSDTMGLIKKCETIIYFLEQDSSNILINTCIPNDVIEKFKMLFGEEHIFTKLIKYGVIAFYPTITYEIKEYFNFIIDNYNINLVLGNLAVTEYEFFKEFNCIIVYSLKYKNFEKPYWLEMEEEDIYKLIYRFSNKDKIKRVFIVSKNDCEIFENNVQRLNNKIKIKSHLEKCFMKQVQNNYVITNVKRCVQELEYPLIDYLLQEDSSGNVIQYIENNFLLTNKNKIDKKIFSEAVNKRVFKLKRLNKNNLIKLQKLNVDSELYELTISFIKNEYDESVNDIELINKSLSNIILNLEEIKDIVNELNTNRYGGKLSNSIISKIIMLWIDGKSYSEICSEVSSFDLQEIIEIISCFTSELICNKLNLINNIVLEETNEYLFNNIKQVLDYIKLGCYSFLSTYIYKWGVFDRGMVMRFSSFIEKNYDYGKQNNKPIKDIILENLDKFNLNRLEFDIIKHCNNK